MNLRTLLSVYGALSAIGGALWVVVPGRLLSGFGVVAPDPVAVFLASLFGGAAIGLGIMAWFARGAEPSRARNALVLGITTVNAFWFVLVLPAPFSGNFNGLAWVPVGVYGLFTVLFMVAGRASMKQGAPVIAG